MQAEAISIQKVSAEGHRTQEDLVAVEAQFRVYVDGTAELSFTCTPDNLEEMATGALFSKGYIQGVAEIASLRISGTEIFVTRKMRETAEEAPVADRPTLRPEEILQAVTAIFNTPDTLFNRTGCAHCCALMQNREILCTFEDIGRHNALDKAIGFALQNGIPMHECAVFTSGRISGDYMAKIIHAGFPIAVSRAAVTSEAVRLAKEHGVTLYGFVRGSSANLYNP